MVTSQFDVRGSCPLVTHYLRSKNLEVDAGQRVNVTRSELRNLPPLDAPTYRDVIKDTFKTIKTIEKGIHKYVVQLLLLLLNLADGCLNSWIIQFYPS